MDKENPISFATTLEKFEANLWNYHIQVPLSVSQMFLDNDSTRVVCELNGTLNFQCALMPKGDGSYFININKKIRDTLLLKIGSPVRAQLWKDDSEYGLPMPEELNELLLQDEEGNRLFHALTPGKQRNLIFIAGNVKNSDIRIKRAIVIVNHLKLLNGKIDFKKLGQALKQKS